MNMLYGGSYRERFDKMIPPIQGQNVVELCFGDAIIADYCRRNQIRFIGFDMNEEFVRYAQKKVSYPMNSSLLVYHAAPIEEQVPHEH